MSTTTSETLKIAKPRFDGDKVLAVTCVVIPLIGLVLFFLYPMVTVLLRSLTTTDGTYGCSQVDFGVQRVILC